MDALRLLTLHVGAPLRRIAPKREEFKIPILMYHSVASDIDSARPCYYRTVTAPRTFESHMGLLRQEKINVVTLSEAIRLLNDVPPSASSVSSDPERRSREPGVAVLTFDDGFRDFYTTAFPILERYGYRATVFLSSGYLDKNFVTGRECLRSQEVRELVEEGVEFGSHTVNHLQLRSLTDARIVAELRESKKRIEDTAGTGVDLFSYPYRFPEEDAKFKTFLASCLVDQGYVGGVTTAIGRAGRSDHPLFLRRLPVNDCDDPTFLKAKLAGAYDWMRHAQIAFKQLKRHLPR